MKNIGLMILTFSLLTACASGIDASKRLGTCVIEGNVDHNCELSTLEGKDAE